MDMMIRRMIIGSGYGIGFLVSVATVASVAGMSVDQAVVTTIAAALFGAVGGVFYAWWEDVRNS